METYEIECLMEYMYLKNKESWEQTRTIGYITAQCQSTKKIDPKEMMTFPWEKEMEEEDRTPTQEDRDAIFREMKEMEKKLNIQQ